MTASTKVTRVAGWTGWCTPCQREDRPLVLTRSGPSGLRAWLAGADDADRHLLLTCAVCGHWQVVPPREEDDPEVVVTQAWPAAELPTPRAETSDDDAPRTIDLTDDAPASSADVAAAAAALSALAASTAYPTPPPVVLRTS